MKPKNEVLLFSAAFLSLLSAVSFYSMRKPGIAGAGLLISLLVFRLAEKRISRHSNSDIDELKVLYTQKAVEITILVAVLLAPSIDKLVSVTVLGLIFVGETLREDLEAVSKSVITPYAGFEFRSAVLSLGMIGQMLVEYSLFYAATVVGVMTLYEIGRTTRIGLEI